MESAMTPEEQTELVRLQAEVATLRTQLEAEASYSRNLEFRDLRNYTVECYLCGKVTRDIMPSERKSHQGDGCSTAVSRRDTGEVILGASYGSMYDMDCFLVVDADLAKALLLNRDHTHDSQYSVCDECIVRRLVEGKLQPVEISDGDITPRDKWPAWAVVRSENTRDDLMVAMEKIERLEAQLAKFQSLSALAALQIKYQKLCEYLTDTDRGHLVK